MLKAMPERHLCSQGTFWNKKPLITKVLEFCSHFHKMFSFNSGNFEKCVTLLRDKHKSKDLAPVVQSIFSHESVVKKNQLTIKLIVSTKFNLY